MKMTVITTWVLVTVLLAVGVYDVCAILWGEPGSSVSTYIASYARRFPVLPFAVGVLFGHLFWPTDSTRNGGVNVADQRKPQQVAP